MIFELRRDDLENVVADDVAVALVVEPEVIEVEEEKRDLGALAQAADAPLSKAVAPSEAGKRVPRAAHFTKEHRRGNQAQELLASKDRSEIQVVGEELLGDSSHRSVPLESHIGNVHHV